MIVRTATAADVVGVVLNLREADAREVYAGRFDGDPFSLVEDIEARRPFSISLQALCEDDGEPVALLGVWIAGPGLGEALMLATDDWPSIAAAAHRYVLRRFLPFVCVPNLRRMQCRCWAGHTVARRWLARLGFVEEGIARRLGKGGEDFIHCAWFPPAKSPPEGV